MADDVVIRPGLVIPRSELRFRATRAGGPGGQHVNTSSTRVELLWDVQATSALTEEQRGRILQKLANRIGDDGVLRLTSAGSRSQHQNKEDATARFAKLIARALHVAKPRKRTRPPKAAQEKRLRKKKQRSEKKQRRGPVELE